LTKKRVLFVITEDWALISHRLHLINDAIAKGFVVGLATRITKYKGMLEDRGVKVFQWDLKRKSLNPIREIHTILNLSRILRYFKPDIIHAVAQKPIIYVGLARIFYPKSGLIANLGGVGYIFTSNHIKAKILKPIIIFLLKYVLFGNKTRLIMQNSHNINTFTNSNIIKKKYIRLVRGAGVEIEKFLPHPIPNGIPIVILAGRMLRDKGVFEFSRVAQRINSNVKKALFVTVGEIDKHNPETLSQSQIDKWVESGILEHWGRREDMVRVYSKASIVCLPSYNEGLPKVLLEGASCARPLVAFDVPGCRDVIEHNVNGFLVEFGNENELKKSLVKLIKNKKLSVKMGKKGRKIVQAKFSSQIINKQIFNIWNELI
jgi:glycosyltransferase involved in cell wall biosynthesis